MKVTTNDITILIQEREARGLMAMGVTIDYSSYPGGGYWNVAPSFGFGLGGC